MLRPQKPRKGHSGKQQPPAERHKEELLQISSRRELLLNGISPVTQNPGLHRGNTCCHSLQGLGPHSDQSATFLIFCRVLFVEPQALGTRGSTCSKRGTVCRLSLCPCTCTGRAQAALDGVRWVQRGLKAWTVCCQRHLGTATQGKPAGMLKRLTISPLKTTAVDAFLKFCAQKARGRTEYISKAQ